MPPVNLVLRGAVGSQITPGGGPVHTLTPSGVVSSGRAILTVHTQIGSGAIPIPAITGGGSVTWTLIPFSQANQGTPRESFAWLGDGTFDGSDVVVTFTGVSPTVCHIHLIEVQNSKTTRPIVKVWRLPSAADATSHTWFHSRLNHANNALFISQGVGNGASGDITADAEATKLAQTNPSAATATNASIWKQGNFSDFVCNVSWESTSPPDSNYGCIFEIQAAESDDGPTCEIQGSGSAGTGVPVAIIPQGDPGSDIVSISFQAPASSSTVAVLVAISELTTNADPTAVSDSLGNTWAKMGHLVVDATHRLIVYAKRLGASPAARTVTADWPGGAAAPLGSVYQVFVIMDAKGTTDTDWGRVVTAGPAAAATQLTLDFTSLELHSAAVALFAKDSATEDMVLEPGWVPIAGRNQSYLGEGSETQCLLGLMSMSNDDLTSTLTVSTPADLGAIGIEVFGDPAGGESIQVNAAVETDSARPIDAVKARAVVRAIETDVAFPLGRTKVKAVTRAIETDIARPITTPDAPIPVNRATETDVSRPIGKTKAKAVTRAIETDVARPIGLAGQDTIPVVRATEIDSARPIGNLGPPVQLEAVAVSDDQIDLDWRPSYGATGYDIERNGVVIVTNYQGGVSYSDTGLDPATTYTYRVRTRTP